tara:strand:+ start:139 stop:333 length:195 start_codon:yes stop_codon:yes gene_type:complete
LREEDKKKIMEERAKQFLNAELENDSSIYDEVRIAVEEVLGQNTNADSLITVINELIINRYGDN